MSTVSRASLIAALMLAGCADRAADDPAPDAFLAADAEPDAPELEAGETCAEPCASTCCAEGLRCDSLAGRCVACLTSKDCAAPLYCHPQTKSCATSIRIATYNILGSHFTEAGSPICLNKTGAACTSLRAVNTMAVIRGKGGFAAFDIVGVQEMERDQFIQIGQGLSGVDPDYKDEPLKYDRHPIVVDANPDFDESTRTIYWRKDLFERVTAGRLSYPTNDGTNVGVSRPTYAPWVQLRIKKTGETFFVLNHHAAVTTQNMYRSTASALFREQTAKILTAWAESIQTKQMRPVLIMGDLNSSFVLRSTAPKDDDIAYKGDRSRLPYCVMTKSGVLRNAEDAAAGKTGPCPTMTGTAVDHLYVTNDLHVEAHVRTRRSDPVTAPASDPLSHSSDHSPVYVDFGLLAP